MTIKITKQLNANGIEVEFIEENQAVECIAYADIQIDTLFKDDCKKYGVSLDDEQLAILEEVKKNIIPLTPEQLEKIEKHKEDIEKQEKQEARKALMLKGKDYNGYQISFTKDDGDGLVQVKSAFELGLTETTIHFDCGTNFRIKVEDFSAFALWFVTERNKFFIEEV